MFGHLDVARLQDSAQDRKHPGIGTDDDLVALLDGNIAAGQKLRVLRRQDHLAVTSHNDFELRLAASRATPSAAASAGGTTRPVDGIDDGSHAFKDRNTPR